MISFILAFSTREDIPLGSGWTHERVECNYLDICLIRLKNAPFHFSGGSANESDVVRFQYNDIHVYKFATNANQVDIDSRMPASIFLLSNFWEKGWVGSRYKGRKARHNLKTLPALLDFNRSRRLTLSNAVSSPLITVIVPSRSAAALLLPLLPLLSALHIT